MNNLDKESLNKAVFTTSHIIAGLPITQVYHDDDGDWQFFGEHGEPSEESARVVSLGEILELDKSLEKVISNLPKGYEAYRDDEDSEWYFKYDDGTIENLN